MVTDDRFRCAIKDDHHIDFRSATVHEDVLQAPLRMTIDVFDPSIGAIMTPKVGRGDTLKVRPKIERRNLFLRDSAHRRFERFGIFLIGEAWHVRSEA